MTTQNYLIVENNIVTNNVLWDGEADWMPPSDSIQLVQATTPAIIWQYNNTLNVYELIQVLGAGNIGFTWDGSVLTTNLPKPPIG